MTRKVAARNQVQLSGSFISFVSSAVILCTFCVPATEATEYFVAVDHPNASDTNTGLSPDHPFKTLARAVQNLLPGNTLNIESGVYREPLRLGKDGTESSPIVVRAYPGDEGEVVIRGSDVVKGWTNDGGGLWSVSWVPLPLIHYPPSWPSIDEYAQRREMVFVDGTPLRQVMSRSDLAIGRFWMDDAAQRIHIHYSGDPNIDQVEISARTRGVYARGRSHLIFRGLSVEHVSTDVWIGALSLGPNVLVEDCRIEHNNGVGIEAYSESVIMRTTSSHNGRLGIGLAGSDSLFDSNVTNHNSWRYGRWAAGGIKVVDAGAASRNRIIRHQAKHNNGPGIAFDTVSSGNVVEASFFDGNLRAGIIFEAMAGPNWAINNVIVGTLKQEVDHPLDGVGVLIDCARDTRLYNNTIVDVKGSGIAIRGGSRNDGAHYNADTRAHNNIIVDPGQSAIQFRVWGVSLEEQNRESHVFDNNIYFGGEPSVTYPWNDWSLAEWQENRGQDLNSLDVSVTFNDPSSHDYSLQSGSPAIDAGKDLAVVTEDFAGMTRPQGSRTDIGAYEYPAPPASLRGPSPDRVSP